MSVFCAGISLYLTLNVSLLVAGIEFTLLTFVSFGAPAVLVWAQRFKKYVPLFLLSVVSLSISVAVRSEDRGM